MKLQEWRKHEEDNASGHLMLLFQTVMQLFSMVSRTMRDSGQLSMNGVNLPKQKDLERYAKQVENTLKENEDLKSKLTHKKKEYGNWKVLDRIAQTQQQHLIQRLLRSFYRG